MDEAISGKNGRRRRIGGVDFIVVGPLTEEPKKVVGKFVFAKFNYKC